MDSVKKVIFIGLMLVSGILTGASAAGGSSDAAELVNTLIEGGGGFEWISLLQASIPLLTAGGISLVKVFIPKIPKTFLPFLTPILGAGVEIIAHLTGAVDASPLRGALLGACGVFVHEALVQSKKILTSE